MNIFISISVGLVLHYLFIRPNEVEHYRKECIRDGFVPKEEDYENLRNKL